MRTATSSPHVYALKGKRDLRTFKLSYAPDPSEPRDLVLFAHGYPYRLFGLFPTDIHLLGVSDGQRAPMRCSCSAPTSSAATCSPAWCWRPAPR